jgi:dolichol-phosphate mannosyltransferase
LTANLIIIPTYNEAENVLAIIDKVLSIDESYHVLIIDDGSPDGTADLVKKDQSARNNRLHLLERSGKLGLGTAYIMGFKWALERDYGHVLEMDADFSHNPDDIPRLIEACEKGADMSVGSRYIKGGGVVNWPNNRIFISRGASIYVQLITWMPVHDATAGFVCYTRKVLESLDLDRIRFIGYAFQIEMKFATWKSGFRIKEVPIIFKDREAGTSKMSKGIIQEAVWGVVKMKWNSLFRSYKKKEDN